MIPLHVVAVLLAVLTIWCMRHELTEAAASRLDWALPVVLATAVAVVLLIVSPGKRFALWALCIGGGLALGLAAGAMQTAIKDFALKLVRVRRTWDGVAAAVLLLFLALTRLVTTDVTGRQSGGHGVLGGLAALIAAFLLGRVIALQLYTAPRSIHLDMVRGQKRHATD
jgi:hypothetical protein